MVLSHVLFIWLPNSPVLRVLSYGLGIFFFLAGYFYKKEAPKIFFRKNVKSLLIPYIGYYILNYIAWLIGTLFLAPEMVNFKEIVVKPFLGLIVGNGTSSDFSTAVSPPLWFLPAFFIARTLAFYLIKPNNIFLTILYGIIICFLGYLSYQLFNFQLFSIISAFMAYPFIVIGYLFKKYKLIENVNTYALVPLSLIFYIINYYVSVKNQTVVDFNNLNFGRNIGLFYIGQLTMLLGSLFLALSLNKVKFIFIDFLSKGTLIIMGLQGIVLRVIILILLLTYPALISGDGLINQFSPNNQFLICLIITLSALLLLVPCVILIAKKAPYLTGKS